MQSMRGPSVMQPAWTVRSEQTLATSRMTPDYTPSTDRNLHVPQCVQTASPTQQTPTQEAPAHELLPWRRFLLQIPVVAHIVAKFHTFMEPKGSLSQSQKPNTFLIVRQINPAQTNPPFSLRYIYNITQPSILKFSFRFPPPKSCMHFSSPLTCHMLSPFHPPDRITLKIFSKEHKSYCS